MDLRSFDNKPHRNQAERFLMSRYNFRKNQPGVSEVVSTSRVLTVFIHYKSFLNKHTVEEITVELLRQLMSAKGHCGLS